MHIGLTVKNVEASTRFYRDVVGMEVLPALAGAQQASDVMRPYMRRVTQPEFGQLTDNPGAEILVVNLRCENFVLQLVEYLTRGGSELDLRHNKPGSPHFCFAVVGVDAKFESIVKQRTASVTSEIVRISPDARSFYVEDPDGVPVEFFEFIRSPSSPA
jgi:catechol 2,3-dioxygenase-like lactoylglutathione lyase family enzyme